MAKAKTDTATVVASATAGSDRPTPDNTPVPGGGSWQWDDSVPGWVEKTHEPAAAQAAATESAPQPTATE